MPSSDHPLHELCELWLSKVGKAKTVKEKLFGETARECMQFFNGPHDFMYGSKNARNAIGMYLDQDVKIKTTFKVTTNKVAELVQRFGPSLYFTNPNRQVNPRKPEISNASLALVGGGNPYALQAAQQELGQKAQLDAATSELVQWSLNYTPNELDLRSHSRLAITEALIKGMGCVWTEVYMPRGAQTKLIGSFYDSVERMGYDPDADTEENAKFIYRECIHPVWEVEDEYGYPRGSLKGNFESANAQSMVEGKPEFNRDRLDGRTNDLLIYYKIYSRMGMGGRMKGAEDGLDLALDDFGDNVFLVVAKNIPFPLNLPPDLINQPLDQPGVLEQIKQAVRWPMPFWADPFGVWPVSTLGFHPIPGSPYPMAHMKPGLGELRFINWCLSFLADKVRITARDFIVVAEHLEEDVKTKIKDGGDLEIIAIKASLNRKISDSVQWLQHPPMNRDILEIVEMVMKMFDKRVGLTELMYGMSPVQMRTAEEASLKRQMTTILIDDMSECTQTWQSKIARREGLANRFLMGPADVAPMLGEVFNPQAVVQGPYGPINQPQIGPITSLWMQLVYRPPNYDDPESIYATVREHEYRIEANSLRKPDIERDLANMDQFMQSPFAATIVGRYQATGDPTQINALMVQWCKVRQIDPQPFLFPALPPPPPPGSNPQGAPQPGQPQPQHAGPPQPQPAQR